MHGYCIRAVSMYGAETWPLTEKPTAVLQEFDMKNLKRAFKKTVG